MNKKPKLRFAEFSGEWQGKYGNELFKPISNKNHNSDLPILAITQDKGAVPRDEINYNVSVTEKSIENYKVVEVGDFIISLRSFQGGIEYSNYKGICSPAYIILRNKIALSNDFYRHYFKSNQFILALNKNLEGIRDGKMVSYQQFSEIKIPFPIPEEQQKIADCLTSLDELIEAQEEKLRLLKEHKKGLLQQLFPQVADNENIAWGGKSLIINKLPKLRFPEFSGEWQEKTLGEVATFFRGLTYNSNDIGNKDNLLVLRSSNIQNDKLILDEDLVFVKKECPEEIKLNKGDIVICMSNGSKSLVGKNAEYKGNYDNPITVGAFCSIMRPKNSFIKYILQTDSYKSFISFSIGGGNINNLKNSDLENFISFLPPTPEEQQKIADCLTSLDEVIETQNQNIENLKTQKKGLLQQLFPSVA